MSVWDISHFSQSARFCLRSEVPTFPHNTAIHHIHHDRSPEAYLPSAPPGLCRKVASHRFSSDNSMSRFSAAYAAPVYAPSNMSGLTTTVPTEQLSVLLLEFETLKCLNFKQQKPLHSVILQSYLFLTIETTAKASLYVPGEQSQHILLGPQLWFETSAVVLRSQAVSSESKPLTVHSGLGKVNQASHLKWMIFLD